jgi:hypothetical protein
MMVFCVKSFISFNIDAFSSITNKMQRYTMYLFLWNDLRVSGGSSAHHQELKTVYTASGTCQALLLSVAVAEELELLLVILEKTFTMHGSVNVTHQCHHYQCLQWRHWKVLSWTVNCIFKWKTISFSLIYHTQCIYCLYNLPTRYRNITLVNWSGRDVGRVLLIGQRRNAHKILIGKLENIVLIGVFFFRIYIVRVGTLNCCRSDSNGDI